MGSSCYKHATPNGVEEAFYGSWCYKYATPAGVEEIGNINNLLVKAKKCAIFQKWNSKKEG